MKTNSLDDHSSRLKLLDAAERIMCESGYAAVTTRRVAASAGLKPQLVHYHFKSMDELFLALLKRVATEWLQRQDEAAAADNPLRQMWANLIDVRSRTLLNEFVALGNHKDTVHSEIAKFAKQFRNCQIALIQKVFDAQDGNNLGFSAQFGALILNSLASGILVEKALEMSNGHDEAAEILDNFFSKFDSAKCAESTELEALRRENAHLRSLLLKEWLG